jgi:TRAP-type C4-dicarboxylate transport system permease small subunit
MTLFFSLLQPLQFFNDLAGRIGRFISVIALAMMVFVILLQVFCRYILNNALPWPDEAARFLMLWLTSLMAPIALRQSGFVAIDTLHRYFSSHLVSAIALLLSLISLIVLLVAFQLGWKARRFWIDVFECLIKNTLVFSWLENDKNEPFLYVPVFVYRGDFNDIC